MRSYSSYRMQRHPGGYEVVRGDWSGHEVLQGLQVPKYESKAPQVERSPGPDARLLSHDLVELPMRFEIDLCIFARTSGSHLMSFRFMVDSSCISAQNQIVSKRVTSDINALVAVGLK